MPSVETRLRNLTAPPITAASSPAQYGLGGPAHLPLRSRVWCGTKSSQAGERSLRHSD